MPFYQLKTQTSLHPNKPLTAFYSFVRYGPISLGLFTQKVCSLLELTPPNSNTPDQVYSISIYHISISFYYNTDAQLHVLP